MSLATGSVAAPAARCDTWVRSRRACALGVVVVIGLGLASRRSPGLFPALFGKYPGDALWTLMVLCGWAFVFPRQAPWRIASYALATSFAVECFQLYQAPWASALRATTLGRLTLGTTFGWMDLLAYTVGAGLGLGAEWGWRALRGRAGGRRS